MHKMPDLLFLWTEMLTLRIATLTLLNFSRHVSAIGYRRNLSRTFIRHDCHRRKSANEGRLNIFSQPLHMSY